MEEKSNVNSLLPPPLPPPPSYSPSIIAGLDPLPVNNILTTSSGEKATMEILSPLQKALRQANKEGEVLPGFQTMYPVFENAQQQRYYEPIPFKQLKELKIACAQYGPTAPFTQAIIECLGNQFLPPNDWKQVARACLSGGNYLL